MCRWGRVLAFACMPLLVFFEASRACFDIVPPTLVYPLEAHTLLPIPSLPCAPSVFCDQDNRVNDVGCDLVALQRGIPREIVDMMFAQRCVRWRF